MQETVDAEIKCKAQLGYKAVIADKNDRPKVVSAKYIVRKRRARKKQKWLLWLGNKLHTLCSDGVFSVKI